MSSHEKKKKSPFTRNLTVLQVIYSSGPRFLLVSWIIAELLGLFASWQPAPQKITKNQFYCNHRSWLEGLKSLYMCVSLCVCVCVYVSLVNTLVSTPCPCSPWTEVDSFHQRDHRHGVSLENRRDTGERKTNMRSNFRGTGNVPIDVIGWWNSIFSPNPSISYGWFLAESLVGTQNMFALWLSIQTRVFLWM